MFDENPRLRNKAATDADEPIRDASEVQNARNRKLTADQDLTGRIEVVYGDFGAQRIPGDAYVNRMQAGLRHWINAGTSGSLL
ncbi:MAG: hypothetical protein WD492_01145 [Alkalispirochaeta sp.]